MRMLKSRKLLSLSLLAGAAAAGCGGGPKAAPRPPIASASVFRAVAPPVEPMANPSAAEQAADAPAPPLAPVETGFITASVDQPLLQANGRPACGNVMKKNEERMAEQQALIDCD
jgi:hypothetical protein